ncbi:MAG: ribosome small subunit-dependent GTPase A [Gammaproteobacteria bacterium]|nr:ribosome small subunit-dependent GTPase A [Gammaproteobacteria bacterium]MBU1978711.1 ribosome small subunit-dependent GTPase A [Gammaproteobacteria bacterium]
MGKIQHGQVVAAFGRHFDVETPEGIVSCVTRGKKGGIACGDRLQIEMTGTAQGVIKSIDTRSSLLFRSDEFKEKIIAANVTQIIVVVAAEPAFYEDLVSRCLIAAEAASLKIVIVLNKCDLEQATQASLEKLKLYRDLGYPLVTLSARQDISPLRPYLQGETSVLVGQSGMGKSSIINALLPAAQAHTREISQALNSGKHTTTHARLYHLDDDSHIIDSPGLQEFGLSHVNEMDIAHAFVEFRPYLGHCRFSNCRHLVEPGCAVLEATMAGEIDRRRLGTFHKLVR